MLQELSEDNLAELIGQQPLAFVLYSAGWCGNCRIMKPKFKKFSNEFEDVPFFVVDSENFPNRENWQLLITYLHLPVSKTEKTLVKYRLIKQMF